MKMLISSLTKMKKL